MVLLELGTLHMYFCLSTTVVEPSRFHVYKYSSCSIPLNAKINHRLYESLFAQNNFTE